jgi:hypothetical protein
MKTTGILILIIGFSIVIFTGITYITKEKVVEIGNMEITADKKHEVHWSPLAGVGAILAGGIVLMIGMKKNK